MHQCIPLETLKAQAETVAKDGILSKDQATLALIHGHGYQNVDFSGGLKADPHDDTIPVSAQAS